MTTLKLQTLPDLSPFVVENEWNLFKPSLPSNEDLISFLDKKYLNLFSICIWFITSFNYQNKETIIYVFHSHNNAYFIYYVYTYTK